jgi:hypothetical protein
LKLLNHLIRPSNGKANSRERRIASRARRNDIAPADHKVLGIPDAPVAIADAVLLAGAGPGGAANVQGAARDEELGLGAGEEAAQLRGHEAHVLHHPVGALRVLLGHLIVERGLRHAELVGNVFGECYAVALDGRDPAEPAEVYNEALVNGGGYLTIGECIAVDLCMPRIVLGNGRVDLRVQVGEWERQRVLGMLFMMFLYFLFPVRSGAVFDFVNKTTREHNLTECHGLLCKIFSLLNVESDNILILIINRNNDDTTYQGW